MRAVDATRIGSSAGLQALVVVLVGIALLQFILNFSMPFVMMSMAGAFLLLGFLLRPDLGLLGILLARASTDATLVFAPRLAMSGRGLVGALLTPNTGLVVLVVVGGALVILRRRLPFLSLPGGVLYVLLLLLGLIGTVRLGNLLLSIDQWTPALAGFIIFALSASLFSSPEQARRVVDALAASFVIPAIFGFAQLFTGQGVVLRDIGLPRVTGTFVQANPFGLYLVVILSVFLGQFLAQSGKRKVVAFVIVALATVLLGATYARFAWVGAVVVLGTFAVLRSRVLLLVAPLLLIASLLLVPALGGRLSDPLGGSFADRVSIWRSVIRNWQVSTSEGQGPFAVAVNRLSGLGPGASLRITYGLRRTHPHNDYLRILIDYGVLGLGFYLALLAVLIVAAYHAWKASTNPVMGSLTLSFLALALAYPFMSATAQIFGLMANQVYFWTLAGLTVAAMRYAGEEHIAPAGSRLGSRSHVSDPAWGRASGARP